MAKEIVCLHRNFPHIELEEILQWTCLNGARMLGKDDVLGSFEPGKKPGAVLVENLDWENMKFTDDTVTRRII